MNTVGVAILMADAIRRLPPKPEWEPVTTRIVAPVIRRNLLTSGSKTGYI